MVCVIKETSQLQLYFKYELATKAPALFDEVSLRKGTKSALSKVFRTKSNKNFSIPTNAKYVLDGGHLLHSVIWPKPATYEQVIQMYGSYILSHYGSNALVVFDGYPNYPTTKTEEQKRRAVKKTSSDIFIEGHLVVTVNQPAFLTNNNNKRSLINLLRSYLNTLNITTHQAEADADVAIVNFALESA